MAAYAFQFGPEIRIEGRFSPWQHIDKRTVNIFGLRDQQLHLADVAASDSGGFAAVKRERQNLTARQSLPARNIKR